MTCSVSTNCFNISNSIHGKCKIVGYSLFICLFMCLLFPALSYAKTDGEGGEGNTRKTVKTSSLARMSSTALVHLIIYQSESQYLVTDEGMDRGLTRKLISALLGPRGLTEYLLDKMARAESVENRKEILRQELKRAKREEAKLLQRWLNTLPDQSNTQSGSILLKSVLLLAFVDDPELVSNGRAYWSLTPEQRAISDKLYNQLNSQRKFIEFIEEWEKNPAVGPRPI